MIEKLSFDQLGLSADLLKNLIKLGYENPTDIQAACIPQLLDGGADIIGQAQTGTGKTAAFSLPIIERIAPGTRKVQALILVPTRELAKQICDEIDRLKGERKIDVLAIYGGQSYSIQFKALKKGAHIVIATPGRMIDLLKREMVSVTDVKFMVLDEADEMLNMGFIEDVETILSYTPDDRRTLLFSATMPPALQSIAKRYLQEKKEIKIKKKQLATHLTKQLYYNLWEKDKFEALKRIIDSEPDFYGIVFCRTKVDADNINQKLHEHRYKSEALHGDISQNLREKIIRKFKHGYVKILVATDVAARGIDVKGLTHVVNYTLPTDTDSYIHRIGRTGRAGATGTAISFISPHDKRSNGVVGFISKGTLLKEEPPTVKRIIKARKRKIYEAFRNSLKEFEESKVNESVEKHCFSIAKNMLSESSCPTKVLSALLKLNYAPELTTEAYRTIESPAENNYRCYNRNSRRFRERRRMKRSERNGGGSLRGKR